MRLFAQRPDLRGRLTFVQIGVPSRSNLDSYGAIEAESTARCAQVNARHGVAGRPPPICYYKGALPLTSLVALYRLAQFCIVSSLHDGMNLVAKEFVAARDDEDGVLVLSALAGAAQELTDALIINPYDVDGFADGARPGNRHAARGAASAHAGDAQDRRRAERVRLGVGHPRRAREPLDEAAPVRGAGP